MMASGLAALQVGELDAKIRILEGELLGHHDLAGEIQLLELGLDRGLEAVAIDVVLGQERDLLCLQRFDDIFCDDCRHRSRSSC